MKIIVGISPDHVENFKKHLEEESPSFTSTIADSSNPDPKLNLDIQQFIQLAVQTTDLTVSGASLAVIWKFIDLVSDFIKVKSTPIQIEIGESKLSIPGNTSKEQIDKIMEIYYNKVKKEHENKTND